MKQCLLIVAGLAAALAGAGCYGYGGGVVYESGYYDDYSYGYYETRYLGPRRYYSTYDPYYLAYVDRRGVVRPWGGYAYAGPTRPIFERDRYGAVYAVYDGRRHRVRDLPGDADRLVWTRDRTVADAYARRRNLLDRGDRYDRNAVAGRYVGRDRDVGDRVRRSSSVGGSVARPSAGRSSPSPSRSRGTVGGAADRGSRYSGGGGGSRGSGGGSVGDRVRRR